MVRSGQRTARTGEVRSADSTERVLCVNDYFVGVGPRVAEVRDRGEPLQLPCRLPRVGACAFSLSSISLQSLRSVLYSMKSSSATGSDGVSIRIFKLCFDAIGHVLLFILSFCLTTCEFPASWKHSVAHPVHKSGSPSEASNFRPISILPAFAKLIEKVAQLYRYTYMAGNYLFFIPARFPFLPLHRNRARRRLRSHPFATDRQELTLLCHLDLFKCFDVIDRSKLLSKLQPYFMYLSDQVFLLPPWPYSTCLYS